MSTQTFDALPRRIETGPVKFGDDRTGLFIRGDELGFLRARLQDEWDWVYSDIQSFNRRVVTTNDEKVKNTSDKMKYDGLKRLIEMIDACQEPA